MFFPGRCFFVLAGFVFFLCGGLAGFLFSCQPFIFSLAALFLCLMDLFFPCGGLARVFSLAAVFVVLAGFVFFLCGGLA